ncbi:tRNA preQ1(34) S-adenosylmethionine ribosyltransferase-isomerase QueA [Patescibacteria group bacterium]|nr:tRNA preQ1(34) S-adenosylmethionine ribosyltransferase-isomerase QueA [Patescibacteria group bacterium]
MKTSDFNYNLPQELIAQHPATPRDSSRLMIVDKRNKEIEHKHFYDIVDYLKPGDLIVWNNSKVFKARLFGRLEAQDSDINDDGIPDKPLLKQQEVEIFLVRPMENQGVWKVLAKPGRRVKPGMIVRFAPDFYCEVMLKEPSGDILVQFPHSASSLREPEGSSEHRTAGQADIDEEVRQKANKYGHIPVPPYIKEQGVRNKEQLTEDYQTIYAKDEGSVAAPTAGFHFTTELIEKIKDKGVEFAEVTLHVGLGTFLPVKSERVEDHTMHSEWVELSQENADKINKAKTEGRRVVAVGTTTVRTLEGVVKIQDTRNKQISNLKSQLLDAFTGDINIFITPGFEFKVVDAMITNFHLPKSTLLMLVSAFVGDRLVGHSLGDGREFMLQCYKEAVTEKYRFYSFGDAMLIS